MLNFAILDDRGTDPSDPGYGLIALVKDTDGRTLTAIEDYHRHLKISSALTKPKGHSAAPGSAAPPPPPRHLTPYYVKQNKQLLGGQPIDYSFDTPEIGLIPSPEPAQAHSDGPLFSDPADLVGPGQPGIQDSHAVSRPLPNVRFALPRGDVAHSRAPARGDLMPISFYNPVSTTAPSARQLSRTVQPAPVPAPSRLALEVQKEMYAPRQFHRSANQQRASNHQQAVAGPGPRTQSFAQRRAAEAGLVVNRVEGSYVPGTYYESQEEYDFDVHGIHHV